MKKVVIYTSIGILLGALIAITNASANNVIWQIGAYDGSNSEFSRPYFYPDNDNLDYYVGVTPLEAFPLDIRSSDASSGDDRYWYSVNSVTIHFTTTQKYVGVVFHYARFGGEEDYVYYDGGYIGTTMPPEEQDPYPAVDYYFGLGQVEAGNHTLKIQGVEKPSYADGYHWVDAIWLEYSAVVAINDLIDTIKEIDLVEGIERSLVAKLESARDALDRKCEPQSINKLNAFINELKAQRGKKLAEQQADELVEYASCIISDLGSSKAAPAKQRRVESEGKLSTLWGKMKSY